MATKQPAPRPLTNAQIEATIQRMKHKFDALFSEKDAKEQKQIKAARHAALEKLLESVGNAKQRAALIEAIGSSSVPGIPDEKGWRQQCEESLAYGEVLADLRYTLVMADNQSFQHAIEACEKTIAHLLK